MSRLIFKSTGWILGVAEKLLKIQLCVEGLENLAPGPKLFVVNHFTRMETFILPYILYNHTGSEVRSLADAALFKGSFGNYLKALGTVSVRAPSRNRTIIGDLISGRYNWVIYPEGLMVKTKQSLTSKRLFWQDHHRRAPRTGAAVLALKAELIRRKYIEAVDAGKATYKKALEDRYGFTEEQARCQEKLQIVPVNITYYPFRPEENLFSTMASTLFKELPKRLEEELLVEGGLLLKETDMSIYMEKPIYVNDYLDWALTVSNQWFSFVREKKRHNFIMWLQKKRLTKDFMEKIYTRTALNLDHLVCLGLELISEEKIKIQHFLSALYLAAQQIKNLADRRVHPSLQKEFISVLADHNYDPLESILKLAVKEQVIEIVGEYLIIHRAALYEDCDFHNYRLKNPIKVIANEVVGLRQVVAILERNLSFESNHLRQEIVKKVIKIDLNEFHSDYDTFYEEGISKAPSVGEPLFLEAPTDEVGIVLSHGYMAAPAEVLFLAQFLHQLGINVYVVRLKGHGTHPRQLAQTSWKDWLISYQRGIAVIKNSCKHVILGGFSGGGLLALLSAARGTKASALFCINTPLILSDIRSHFVSAALVWNDILKKFNIQSGSLEYVQNPSENPEVNYLQNPVRGVHQLNGLIQVVRDQLKNIDCPSLIIQSDKDPVVSSKSASILNKEVSSNDKELVTISSDSHNVLRQVAKKDVFFAIERFLSNRGLTIERDLGLVS